MDRRTVLAGLGATFSMPFLAPLSLGKRPWVENGTPMKLLFDTDIGSDIDDAVALAYLLNQPSVELLGITTVTGEARKRAALAERLIDIAGGAIPVTPGYEKPRLVPSRQPSAPQATKLAPSQLIGSDAPHDPEAAIDFMAAAIRSHPGEVTLLAVGPFTNVARLLEREPGVSKFLKQLVIMGGKYSDYPTPWGPSEWNGIVDPHATSILFQKIECPVRAFGLDITWQVSMNADQVSRAFAHHPLLREVKRWSEVWFAEREALHFHDPLAAVSLVDPAVCQYRTGTVSVDLTPDRAGFTEFSVFKDGDLQGRRLVEVASSVDPSRFFDQYFSAFGPHPMA